MRNGLTKFWDKAITRRNTVHQIVSELKWDYYQIGDKFGGLAINSIRDSPKPSMRS